MADMRFKIIAGTVVGVAAAGIAQDRAAAVFHCLQVDRPNAMCMVRLPGPSGGVPSPLMQSVVTTTASSTSASYTAL